MPSWLIPLQSDDCFFHAWQQQFHACWLLCGECVLSRRSRLLLRCVQLARSWSCWPYLLVTVRGPVVPPLQHGWELQAVCRCTGVLRASCGLLDQLRQTCTAAFGVPTQAEALSVGVAAGKCRLLLGSDGRQSKIHLPTEGLAPAPGLHGRGPAAPEACFRPAWCGLGKKRACCVHRAGTRAFEQALAAGVLWDVGA